MNKVLSQTNSILKYLKSGAKLSGIEALKLFGCFRLPARVYDLKSRGYSISSKIEHRGGTRYKTYWMED